MSVEVKPNQVRAFTNKNGHVSYYLVVDDGGAKGMYVMWFRSDESDRMLRAENFRPSEEHPLVIDNLNSFVGVFRDIFERKDAASA